jgi:hypothetical protein
MHTLSEYLFISPSLISDSSLQHCDGQVLLLMVGLGVLLCLEERMKNEGTRKGEKK